MKEEEKKGCIAETAKEKKAIATINKSLEEYYSNPIILLLDFLKSPKLPKRAIESILSSENPADEFRKKLEKYKGFFEKQKILSDGEKPGEEKIEDPEIIGQRIEIIEERIADLDKIDNLEKFNTVLKKAIKMEKGSKTEDIFDCAIELVQKIKPIQNLNAKKTEKNYNCF